MSASRRVIAVVEAALERHVGPDTLCVALSGGMDSVVLLDAVANIRKDVSAVHVHHGLSPNADAWAEFCAELCASKKIPLSVHRVSVAVQGRGLEAAARDARYAAFKTVPASWILQGHHADDAVETLMLRLNRGTGLRGMAGIPAVRKLDAQRTLLRPLLEVPRAMLHEYSQENGLIWIEDESNSDSRLDRNYLRRDVMPAITARFPAWRENWLRAARHSSLAQGLLDDLARLDVGTEPERLALDGLRALSSERLRNALRYFLSVNGAELPVSAHLADIERRLRTCVAESTLGIVIEPVALMQYRGELHCVPANRTEVPQSFTRPLNVGQSVLVQELEGSLHFDRVVGTGIAVNRAERADLVLRSRVEAESLKPAERRPSHTLKNLFQEAGVPPWERAWLPRISAGEELVWVPGIGVAAAWQARPEEPGWLPRWEPLSPRSD